MIELGRQAGTLGAHRQQLGVKVGCDEWLHLRHAEQSQALHCLRLKDEAPESRLLLL